MSSVAERLRFVEVNNLDDARPYRDQWNELARRSAFPDIYATWDFVEAWWLAFGSTRQLKIWLGIDDTRQLHFVAPLYCDNDNPRALTIIGNRRADYCQLIYEAGAEDLPRAWLGSMFHRGDWNSIALERTPAACALETLGSWYGPASGRMQKLGAWLSMGQPLIWISREPTHPFIGRERFHEFAEIMRRQSHKKHLNWFARAGKLEFLSMRASNEVLLRLPEFLDLHIKEWRARGEASMFLQDSNRRFYELLTERFAPLGAIVLDVMLLDGRMIAGHFGFEWGRRFYYLKPCFDPDFSAHSPGKLLLANLLQGMSERQVDIFDFLSGLEPYKLKYTAQINETCGVIITRSRIRSLMVRAFNRKKPTGPTAFG